MIPSRKIIVIGGNAAGPAAAAKAKRIDPSAEVILIEASEFISTGSCELPYVLSGEIESINQIIFFTPDTFWEEKKVKVLTKHTVEKIDRRKKSVTVKNLETTQYYELFYDKLILATGSIPNKLEHLDYSSLNVFSFKTIADLISVQNYIKENKSKVVTIIGAGYIGIELVETFSKLGLDVVLIEKEKEILPEFELEISKICKQILASSNVRIFTSIDNLHFFYDKNRVSKFKIDGRLIETDIVITALGFLPNNKLAVESALEIGKSGGVKVNSKLQTSDSNIFAVGDLIEVVNKISNRSMSLKLASIAKATGQISGENAVGGNKYFSGVIKNISIRVFDTYVTSVGMSTADLRNERFNYNTVYAENQSIMKVMPGSRKNFGLLHYDRETKRILGASFIGGKEVSGYSDLISIMIDNKIPVTQLYELSYNYTPSLSPLNNLLYYLGNAANKKSLK